MLTVEAIEVEPRIEPRRAADPFGAEADVVGRRTVDGNETRAVLQRRLAVVVHVFGRACGDHLHCRIPRHDGINAAPVTAVITEQPPLADIARGETAVLNELC